MPSKLRAFNAGKPMRGVRVRLRDGGRVVGLLQSESEEGGVVVRVADEPLPRRYEKRKVEEVEEVVVPKVPKLCYETTRKVLGGVGRHTRRCLYSDDCSERIGVLVSNFESVEQLATFCKGREDIRFATDPPEVSVEEETRICPMLVKGERLPHVAVALAKQEIFLYSQSRTHSIMADSLNRAPHVYSHQIKFGISMRDERVGPTVRLWRYRFHHLPTSWKVPPFTWPLLARCVLDDMERRGEEGRVGELEEPLRGQVLWEAAFRRRERAAALRTTIASLSTHTSAARRREKLSRKERRRLASTREAQARLVRFRGEKGEGALLVCLLRLEEEEEEVRGKRLLSDLASLLLREKEAKEELDLLNAKEEEDTALVASVVRVTTPALSEEESDVSIEAFHKYYYDHDSLDEEQKEVLRARLQHLPQTNGYFVHWTSCYEDTGLHVGFGDTLRKPEKLSFTDSAFAKAINRVQRKDGKLCGKGSIGYKGLFDAPTEKVYMPETQLLRTDAHDVSMRKEP